MRFLQFLFITVFLYLPFKMQCNPCKRPRNVAHAIDIDKCIICQIETDDPITSSHKGQSAIREASEFRKDIVYERLLRLEGKDFVYHVTNDCYKHYTHKKSLTSATAKHLSTKFDTTCEPRRTSRTDVQKRKHPAQDENHSKTVCIVCGQIRSKGKHEKARMSESAMAKKFLKATVSLQDDVFVRTCDLQDECAVFGANLFYHKHCMLSYIRKFEENMSGRKDLNENRTSARHEFFTNCVNEWQEKLQTDKKIPLSDLKQHLNSMLPKGIALFTEKEIRLSMLDLFGEDIYFTKRTVVNNLSFHVKSSSSVCSLDASLDIVQQCAEILRKELLQTNFDLSDKFCDANELKHSWTSTQIPIGWQRFFKSLFKLETTANSQVNRSESIVIDENDKENCDSDQRKNEDNESIAVDDVDYESISEDDCEEEYASQNISCDDKSDHVSTDKETRKSTRVKALFQIMYFNVFNGRRQTPLHVMNSQSVYDKCKSKELITCLNHYGLGISYTELRRFHDNMANLVIKSSQEKVPLPSHFCDNRFTMGAFDNFDHEEATLSGISGSHDTVSVLFQEKPDTLNRKPSLSEVGIAHGDKPFTEQLACQCLRPYTKPARKPELGEMFKVDKDLIVEDKDMQERILRQDKAWCLARMKSTLNSDTTSADKRPAQKVPSWSAFNSLVSKENVPEMIVGFIPVIPFPVTDYQTVYTALKNFQDILKQLDQTHLPVACDEGVYHIARSITMESPREFENIVLVLGGFHMTKVFLGCIGRYLRNSGAESIWSENSVFGPNVVQSVLSGSHYVRSFKGMLLLEEAMSRLQWRQFFLDQGTADYTHLLDLLCDLQEAVSTKDPENSMLLVERFMSSSDGMFEKFAAFRQERSAKSETFLYWDQFIELVQLLRNLIRAEREGNWNLHLATIQSILPYFAVFDCVNYLRWCSLYLEDMRKLNDSAPDVHHHFQQGKFVVKRTSGQFRAVAADQCLEQTINKSQKSSGGIIGSSRKKDFVSKWEITYHEMLEISNMHRELARVNKFTNELTLNHEFNQPETVARENNVSDMIEYIELYENPFEVSDKTEVKLHNIVTQEVMTDEIRSHMTTVKQKGETLYSDFRQERFVKKQKSLAETIHRTNLKTLNALRVQPPSKESLRRQKGTELAAGHRSIEVCQSRGYSTKELFKFDLVQTNYLYDADGLMKKTQKSSLCHELEKHIPERDKTKPSQWPKLPSVFVVDVMANVRKVALRSQRTFGNLCGAFLQMISNTCKDAERIDFVFDSYNQSSIKDSERSRRTHVIPIEISAINEDTPLPVNMDTFWASISNKARLEGLLRKCIIKHEWSHDLHVYVSGMLHTDTDSHCVSVLNKAVSTCPELDLPIEEADVRIVPHALHAVQSGLQRCVIISADTDVVVLALHFSNKLKTHGIQELWLRAGVGSSTRYLPLHIIAEKKPELCKVILAAHILTGCDVTSKVGTKLSALKASPELHLEGFGNCLTADTQDKVVPKAEQYLIKVIKHDSECKTMDELRYVTYHQSRAVDLTELPPSSTAIRSHILRCLYVCHMQMHCLTGVTADPLQFGFEEKDGAILPCKNMNRVPDSLVLVCHCKQCATKRCPCRKAGVPCCIYCSCRGGHSSMMCKNPNIVISVPFVV